MNQTDKKIISELLKDGRTSYKKLGDAVGYTIMGVKRRVEKMLSEGVIDVSARINIEMSIFMFRLFSTQ